MRRDIDNRKRIGLVAHDNKKRDLIEWARFNRELLASHELIATGTTGTLLERELQVPVRCLHSGPLGGDLQIGAMIAEGEIDFLVFFWDPLEPQPHDPDVKALLRIAVVWNIPVACDRATADFMISSPLMTGSYERVLPDYSAHLGRLVATAGAHEGVGPPLRPEAPETASDDGRRRRRAGGPHARPGAGGAGSPDAERSEDLGAGMGVELVVDQSVVDQSDVRADLDPADDVHP